jgi:hypothetical protein
MGTLPRRVQRWRRRNRLVRNYFCIHATSVPRQTAVAKDHLTPTGSLPIQCVDQVLRTHKAHLRRTLGEFAAYYNASRSHCSLNQDTPLHRAIERLGAITSDST